MIPGDWETVRLADIADYKAGRTPARANPDYWAGSEDSIPWVAISDMTEFGTVTATKETITKAAFEHVFRGQTVPAGTLIMSFKLTIGRVAKLGMDACHNEAIISIYPRPGVDQRYLGYFLAQVDYSALQDRQVKGNTLNQEKIDRIEVWLPPLDEQSLIADVLDVLRRSMELQDRALATAQELKRAALRELFTRGLRGEPQKETEIGPVPESWEVMTLPTVCTMRSGGTPPKSDPSLWTGDFPWVSGKDLKQNRLHDSIDHITREAAERFCGIAPAGSVLVLVRGMGLAKGFALSLIQTEMAFNQDLKALIPKDGISGDFLMHVLTFAGQRMLRSVATAAHGTKRLSQDDLDTFKIPQPNLSEQREIAAILEAIDQKIDLHRRKRAVLEELFKALLHKLMTGEIRVADLELSALEDAAPAEAVA